MPPVYNPQDTLNRVQRGKEDRQRMARELPSRERDPPLTGLDLLGRPASTEPSGESSICSIAVLTDDI